jgi:hypothetical protein
MKALASKAPLLLAVTLVSWARAQPEVHFIDATAQARIDFRHVNGATGKRHFIETMGPGCAFVDYDNDGKLDIYLVNGHDLEAANRPPATNALYRNRGDGTFTEVTQAAGVGDPGYGMGVTAGDYDNDGDLDLHVTNYGPNVLYRNNGDGTFTDVSQAAGVGDDRWGVGCAFLDYDNDGNLDLYVANYVDFSLEHPKQTTSYYLPKGQRTVAQVTGYPHPDNFNGVADVLYHNNGDGTFTGVTHQAGVSNPGKGMGMACGDYDSDGDQDIYVANDLTPNFLYRNNGDGTFADVGLVAGVAYNEDGKTESSMGVDFGDYDRDGNLDLLVTNFQEEGTAVYHNEGNGLFSDESVACGLRTATWSSVGWGGGFLDFDNDGELDVFVATGHVLDNVELFDARTTYAQRNFLFRNNGPGSNGRVTFADVSAKAGAGLAVQKPSRGAAFGDYDDDGDVDILVANCNEAPTLLRNDGGNTGHWLRVRTEGVASNRSGIGARVTVVAGDLVQIREVKSGSSLYSQNDLRVSFGLGSRSKVDRIEVRWPSGTVDSVAEGPANQSLTIKEGTGLVQVDE